MKSDRRSRARRAGMTLIEVVAGMAMLAATLTAMAVAHQRFARQTSDVERKRQAIEAAEGLLTGWTADWHNVPIGEAGDFEHAENMSWQTIEMDTTMHESVEVRMVRLEIIDNRLQDVMASIDLMVPPPREQTDTKGQDQEPPKE